LAGPLSSKPLGSNVSYRTVRIKGEGLLYIIGGAARAGKTIIAQEFLERSQVPFLSLDLLKMSLVKGMPEAGIDPQESSRRLAIRLWPVVRGLASTILENARDYLIEGDMILPSQVREISADFPGQIRSCFVGFGDESVSKKLFVIRKHTGPEDWLIDLGEEEALQAVAELIQFSNELREQAREHGVAYFDSSADFDTFKEEVIKYLETGDNTSVNAA
jgi:2-phosphoglycerate kinase